MKCIVIDDERIAREGLADFIKEFDYLENVGLFPNAKLALEKINSMGVDLIFLDIQMPSLNGLDFAKSLADKQTMIIFTTAYQEYALQGYQVNSVGYLLKPIFMQDFKLAIQKAKKLFDLAHFPPKMDESIFFRENGHLVKVDPTQILYVKGMQNYVEINLDTGKKLIIHQTLKSIFKLFSNQQFVQIHKSYIINAHHISKLDGLKLYLQEIGLPIARDRKKGVLMKLMQSGYLKG